MRGPCPRIHPDTPVSTAVPQDSQNPNGRADCRVEPGNDERNDAVALRPYRSSDEPAAIALWLRAWQAAYPSIDFAARLDWWSVRWRNELVPVAQIAVAESSGIMVGFVTVDP